MKLFAVLAVVALAGCAAPPLVYSKPGDQSGFAADKAQCQYQAVSATASAPSGSFSMNPVGTVSQDIATGMKQNELFDLCMTSKGWTRQ